MPSELAKPDVEKVTLRLIELVRSRYVFPDVADQICKVISTKFNSDLYIQLDSIDDLAAMLTTDLQSINNDRHLQVGDIAQTLNIPTKRTT